MNYLYVGIIIVICIILVLIVFLLSSKKKRILKVNKKNSEEIFSKKKFDKLKDPDLEEAFLRAGMISDFSREWYFSLRKKSMLGGLLVGIFIIYRMWKPDRPLSENIGGILICLLSIYIGFKFPLLKLRKKTKERVENISYFLPVVIEQLIVGISSALDIGPTIDYVVHMAEDRGSHNPVTLMLKQVQDFTKSGDSLDSALHTVALLSRNDDIKHSFLFLSQVYKHGGDVIKQLTSLSDSVTSQREVRIDSQIKKLELKATGPVALIFVGNFGVILSCIIMELTKSFAGVGK